MTTQTAPDTTTEHLQAALGAPRETRRERLEREIAEYDAAAVARRASPAATVVAADYAMFE